MSQRYFPISWDELHRDARALAWRLMEIGPFDRIVAIARGGLAPAAIIARELDIRLVDTICIVSYREIQGEKAEERGALDILKGLDGDGTGVLVIDDLVDSGETAKAVKAMLPNAHIATVYAKPAGVPFADTYVTLVSQDTWIIFPWDEGEVIAKAHAAGKRA
ncbi:MAG: xanthine phosphoribosyltransferase [Rhodospirillales bacterium]